MNTLEMYGIFVFVFLSNCVQDARKWIRHEQPWEVLDWLWAMFHGLMLSICSVALVYLVTHPAEIQPMSGWESWVLWFGLVVIALVILARLGKMIGRRIRQLGRSS